MLVAFFLVVCFNATATTEIYTYGHTLSLHDALPIYSQGISTRWAKRGNLRHVGSRHRMVEGCGRRGGGRVPAAYQICAADLLYHRACRGVLEPQIGRAHV